MVGRPRLTDRARLTGNWCEQVIPGLNDSDQELTRLAEYLAGVSPDIPWHVAAFHKDYRMPDPKTPAPRPSYMRQRLVRRLAYITSMRAIFLALRPEFR